MLRPELSTGKETAARVRARPGASENFIIHRPPLAAALWEINGNIQLSVRQGFEWAGISITAVNTAHAELSGKNYEN
jgi:hypothetical protein